MFLPGFAAFSWNRFLQTRQSHSSPFAMSVLWALGISLTQLVVCSSGFLVSETTSTPASPNIVFVLADDLGYNDIGYHNERGVKSPVLNRLSAAGVRLENYYVQPVCSPTRTQFMSGRMQIHTGEYTYV